MAEPTPRRDLPEIHDVTDPDARRAIRAVYQHLQATIDRQQLEIEALLEFIVEKRVGSLTEYKLLLGRLQQPGNARHEKIHELMTHPEQAAVPGQPGQKPGPDQLTPRERMQRLQ
jgi:hypothetical protein